MNPEIRNMKKDDLNVVVQIHIRTFPDFFLTSLGKGFLHELYMNFLLDTFSICKVIEKDANICGFIIGSLKPKILFRKMLFHKGYLFLFYATKALFKRPILVSKKLFFAMKYRGESPNKITNAALLSSIGVDPVDSKSGFGTLLIKSFCDEAFSKSASAVYLTTDMVENDSVNNFYLKNGFQFEGVLKKTNGRLMIRYIKFKDESCF